MATKLLSKLNSHEEGQQTHSVASEAVVKCVSKSVSLSGFRKMKIRGGLAQLVERLPCKQEVSGSIPLISTIWVASSVG